MNSITFYQPWVERNLISDLFDNMNINDTYDKECCGCVPANIIENEKDFRIELSVPGYTKEMIKVSVEKNVLTIQSVKKEEKEKSDNYVSREFGTHEFERNFILSKDVNTESITASFNNGILGILIPKKEEVLEKTPVEIAIQ